MNGNVNDNGDSYEYDNGNGNDNDKVFLPVVVCLTKDPVGFENL